MQNLFSLKNVSVLARTKRPEQCQLRSTTWARFQCSFVLLRAFLRLVVTLVNKDNKKALYMYTTTLAFQAGTVNNFSLTDSYESKNLIGTPELKTHPFIFLEPYFQAYFFF